jgi:hypothetical protein
MASSGAGAQTVRTLSFVGRLMVSPVCFVELIDRLIVMMRWSKSTSCQRTAMISPSRAPV